MRAFVTIITDVRYRDITNIIRTPGIVHGGVLITKVNTVGLEQVSLIARCSLFRALNSNTSCSLQPEHVVDPKFPQVLTACEHSRQTQTCIQVAIGLGL